jgi:hypothetical protein
MISRQRQIARCIFDARDRHLYQMHMCGLCHTLGDHYGLPLRLFTNHEMILLNLLINSQRRQDVEVITRRCPLKPWNRVSSTNGIASEFSAAATVGLAHVGLQDAIADHRGRNPVASLALWLLGGAHGTALHALEAWGFEKDILLQLYAHQQIVEGDQGSDPAGPTAATSAALFAATALATQNHQNVEPLKAMGTSYGTYLYLWDAFRDYPQDVDRGHFNPLRKFKVEVEGQLGLGHSGLKWLLEGYKEIYVQLRDRLDELHLYRYQDSLRNLICQPIERIMVSLSAPVSQGKHLVFRKWKAIDCLKMAVFIPPGDAALEPSEFIELGTLKEDWAQQFISNSFRQAEPLLVGSNTLADIDDLVMRIDDDRRYTLKPTGRRNRDGRPIFVIDSGCCGSGQKEVVEDGTNACGNTRYRKIDPGTCEQRTYTQSGSDCSGNPMVR